MIEKRLNEIKIIRALNSRDFRFKNWHASTINLLKTLPSDFTADVNDFRKLAFTDTKYHRGNRFFNPDDDTRYRKDLDSAAKILKKITSLKKEPELKKEARPKKKLAAKKEIKTGRKIPTKIGKSAARKKPPPLKIKKSSRTKTKKTKKK